MKKTKDKFIFRLVLFFIVLKYFPKQENQIKSYRKFNVDDNIKLLLKIALNYNTDYIKGAYF